MTCHHGEEKRKCVEWRCELYDTINYEWVTEYKSFVVDLDLHRWKCTRCGHIGYYSGRARDHFEGKTDDSFIQETNEEYLKNK